MTMRSVAMSWTRMKRAGVGLSIIVALGMTVAAAEAAVGGVLGTVAIPAGAPSRRGSGSTCAGIAWDSSDKTISQTGWNASNANVVFHFGESAASALPSILANCVGTTDSLTGVAVAGTSLFVSCATPSVTIGDEIRQG